MVSYVFNTILRKAARAGITPSVKRNSRQWFRDAAKNVSNVDSAKLIRSGRDRQHNVPMLGNMYLFRYDPKHKKTLPYYDRYPLIFPIAQSRTRGTAINRGSFLGLNLHYLPLPLRAKLMDALYSTVSNEKLDETTKLRISYGVLNQAAKYRFFQPCIKRYLVGHVQTKFLYILPSEWEMSLFLPTDRFVGSNKNAIYRDSRNRIR